MRYCAELLVWSRVQTVLMEVVSLFRQCEWLYVLGSDISGVASECVTRSRKACFVCIFQNISNGAEKLDFGIWTKNTVLTRLTKTIETCSTYIQARNQYASCLNLRPHCHNCASCHRNIEQNTKSTLWIIHVQPQSLRGPSSFTCHRHQ